MIMKVPEYSSNIDNLMKYLLYELKVKNMDISKTLMIKLIFKIKKELGEDHSLYSQLPYYWYFYGQYSQPVADSFNFFSDAFEYTAPSRVLLKDEYFDDFESNEFISKYPEIEQIAHGLISDDLKFYKNIRKDIYRQYAPFDIMYPFKFNVFDIADKFRSAQQFNSDEFIKNLFKCESKLPCGAYYVKYNNLFSKFVTNLDLINEENNFNSCWDFLRDPIQDLWRTFVKGVRVEFKDDYYSYKEPAWNREYISSLDELSITINQTKKLVHLDNLQENDYTPAESKMINATIGGYLRG